MLENYYVDKTMMIRDFIEEEKEVTLVTFGKTLNMTMLREFFDVTKDSNVIFEGLEIKRLFHHILQLIFNEGLKG